MEDFLRSHITGELSEVPGLEVNVTETLKKHGINTTFQLIGMYLVLKKSEDCDDFHTWMNTIGVSPNISEKIVNAIAEKTFSMIKGYYGPNYS